MYSLIYISAQYLTIGILVGLLSGLFGIGGGTVIVAFLSLIFSHLGFIPSHIMHLAIGTSLATIVLTSLSSTRAHHLKHNVDWHVLFHISPAVMIGAFLGSRIAAQLQGLWLNIIFIVFLLIIATQMLIKKSGITSSTLSRSEQAPTHPLKRINLAGLIIGAISSIVGIGGGLLSVPYLTNYQFNMRRAIGTSAAIGFPIALAGAIGYGYHGSRVIGLPQYSAGFIYLPALLGISLSSIFTAPLGAKLAQILPITILKKLFAILLFLVAFYMLWQVCRNNAIFTMNQ